MSRAEYINDHKKLYSLVTALVLICIIITTFAPAINFDFINFDDPHYAYENPHVLAGLTPTSITWAFTNVESGHWQPLTWLSHQLDIELFGVSAKYSHLVNIVLHALACSLLFVFFYLSSGQLIITFLATLIFALHPLRIESVVWISERKDVLSMFFFSNTLLLYFFYHHYRRKFLCSGLILSWLLCLLAKPTMITLPIILLVIDKFLFKKCTKQQLIEKLPLFIISIIFACVALFAQGTAGGLKTASTIGLLERINLSSLNYVRYLMRLFYPDNLSIFHPLFIEPYYYGLAAAAVLLGIGTVLFFYKNSMLQFAFSWFLITALPTIGILQIGGQAFAERWTYLPHVGLVYGITYAVSKFYKTAIIIAAILLIPLCNKFYIELAFWQDSVAIFSQALKVEPNNFMAHNNLGVTLDKQGNFQKARFHFQESVRLSPTYPEALNNLGTIRGREGNFSEALRLFEEALKYNPKHVSARYHLALTYQNMGLSIEALNEWLKIILVEPEHTVTINSIKFLDQQIFKGNCNFITAKLNTVSPSVRAELKQSVTNLKALPVAVLTSSINCLNNF